MKPWERYQQSGQITDQTESLPGSFGNQVAGLLLPGNVNLNDRPSVKNNDGSISTVRSMSINVDGKEVLIPTVSDDGRIMSDSEAIDQFNKTGRHLGIFDTPENATNYAQQLHNAQADQYLPKERRKVEKNGPWQRYSNQGSDEAVSTPQPPERSFMGKVSDLFTGADRETKATKTLPEFDLPFEFSKRQAKTALGLLTTFDSKRQVNILKENYPELTFEEDEKGNVIVDGTAYGGGKGILNMPGISARDLLQAGFQVAAFTPAGKAASLATTVPGKMAAVGTASAITQAGQDVTAQATGATDDVSLRNIEGSDVAMAGIGGAAGEGLFRVFSKAFPAIKNLAMKKDVDIDSIDIDDKMRNAFKQVASDNGADPNTVNDDVIRDFMRMARESVSPKKMPETYQVQQAQSLTDEFGIPYTRGQATRNVPQLNFEDSARYGGLTDRSQQIVQGFDKRQAQAIESARTGIQGRISGGEPQVETVNQATELVAGGVKSRAAAADQAIQEAYQSASEKVAALRYGDVLDLTQSIRGSLTDRAVDFGENSLTPATKQAVSAIEEFINKSASRANVPTGRATRQGAQYPYGKLSEASGPKRDPLTLKVLKSKEDSRLAPSQVSNRSPSGAPLGSTNLMAALTGKKDFAADIRNIEFVRRKLNQYIDAAANPTDRANVLAMKRSLDGWVDGAIDKSLFAGDDEAVELLKKARSLRADYARKFQATPTKTKSGATIQDDAGKVIERIVEANPTNEELANYLFGSAKLAKNSSQRIAKRLKDILGESQEWNSIREAAFMKLTGTETGAAPISAAKLSKRLDEAVKGSGEQFMKELFTADEIAQFQRFADAVKRAQPAKINASGTAYKQSQIFRQALNALTAKIGLASGDLTTMAAIQLASKGSQAVSNRAANKAAEQATQAIVRPLKDIRPELLGIGGPAGAAINPWTQQNNE